MVSGVSFKGASGSGPVRSKNQSIKMGGIFLLFSLIVIALLAWLGSAFYLKSVKAHDQFLEESIQAKRSQIENLVNGAPREFIVRSRVMADMLYREQSIQSVAQTLGVVAVPGVVLQSIFQNADSGSAVIEIVADASQYDEVAAQIAAWKSSDSISSVQLRGMSKNEETGFIVFTAQIRMNQQAEHGVYGVLDDFNSFVQLPQGALSDF